MPGPSSSDANFEATFADLAFARLRDKAPSLLDYLVGFQMIDKNDEETHAVGVFGFKVGKDWVYSPVFFINGELKGHELMYIKGQDSFVPMTEQWVNYILNRRPKVLGEAEEIPRQKLNLRQPDFDLFARAPYIGSKSAAAAVDHKFTHVVEKLRPWAQDFMPVFCSEPWAEKYASLTITDMLKKFGKRAALPLFQSIADDERFARSVLKFYDPRELIEATKQADIDDVSKQQRKGKSTLPKPIVITRGDDNTNVMLDLTEKEKEQLAKGEYIVRDTPDEHSIVVKSQMPLTLNGPDRSGFFDVMTKGLEAQKMLVVVDAAPVGYGALRHQRVTVVIDQGSKQFGNYGKSDIMVGRAYGAEDFKSWWNGLPAGDSVTNGDIGLLINDKGNGTGVFEVNQVASMHGRTEVKIYGKCGLSSGATVRKEAYRPESDQPPSSDIESLVFTDKEGDKLTRVGESYFVPKGFKFLKITKLKRDNYPHPVSPNENCSPKNLALGTLDDVRDSLKTAADKGEGVLISMRTDGLRYIPVVNDEQIGYMPKEAAFKYLVYRHGMTGADASMLIKSACLRRNGETFFVKYAWGEPPTSAWFPEPITGTEHGINAVTQYPSQMTQNLGQNDNTGAREAMRHRIDDDLNQPYRNARFVDGDAKRFANSASQLGQKEVLDTSVISGLIKTMDTDNAVDGYLGDLLLALDRLGRILFMYYWHNDKFRERYGTQDMSELEDNLRNVFKSLGELSLFLKQKTIEPDKGDTSEARLTDVLTSD